MQDMQERPSIFWIIWVFTVFMWMVIQQNSDQGHAWNIVRAGGRVLLSWMPPMEISRNFWKGMRCSWQSTRPRSMIIFVLFRMNMRQTYTPSAEFQVPACTATAQELLCAESGACFDSYDWQSVYDYCKMRLDNGAAVVRFKFSTQKGYEQAYQDLIANKKIQQIALYYIYLQGVEQVEYHYGVLENMKTMYFMF